MPYNHNVQFSFYIKENEKNTKFMLFFLFVVSVLISKYSGLLNLYYNAHIAHENTSLQFY